MPTLDHLHYFVALRQRGDGDVWIDTTTLSACREVTLDKIERLRRETPHWHAANPVKRITRCTITIEGEG